ncbi:RNA-directed DNA polymerase, eukaryota, reverse transcriptase zinc-binding domain protein [Tanacetum coccineum]
MKEDVSTISVWVKLHGVPVTAFSEDGLSFIATKLDTPLMIDSYTSDMCVGKTKTLNRPSQTSRGVSVGPKIGFRPQKEYRPVSKKPTTSSSGNKKKGVVSSIEGGTTNLVNNEATSCGSSFMHIDNSSTRTTPIIDKIEKFKELLTSEKATHVDEVGNPLKKVEFLDDYDSKDVRDSYDNGDYEEDKYDDDMYEGHDLPQELQAICDNLDIRVRGRKKK